MKDVASLVVKAPRRYMRDDVAIPSEQEREETQ